MALSDEDFFVNNVVKVNKMIEHIILATLVVPVFFYVFTKLGFWIVSTKYVIILSIYCIASWIFLHILNKFKQISGLVSYIGMCLSTIFVCFLGTNSAITLGISYAVVPFLSCLYYNKRMTIAMNFINYVGVWILTFIRSFTIKQIYIFIPDPNETPVHWWLTTMIGYSVEFVFVFLGSLYIVQRASGTFSQLVDSNEESKVATKKLNERNAYIMKVNTEIEQKNQQLQNTQFEIIEFISKVLGSHDLFTGRHVIHTKKYVEIICKELKAEGYYLKELTDENIELYSTAAFLHDIGKIHVPEGVLNKIGKFTDEEFEIMKSHPDEGRKLLEFLPKINDGNFNEIAIQMAYCHHEKWDGSGYPRHISGKEIPLCARIMAAADVMDALISRRLYKEPMTIDAAIEVFRNSKGQHFEPCIAEAVINCKDMIAMVDTEFKAAESATELDELEWWKKYHSQQFKVELKKEN